MRRRIARELDRDALVRQAKRAVCQVAWREGDTGSRELDAALASVEQTVDALFPQPTPGRRR